MPILKMYIGKMFIAKHEVEFVEMETLEERVNHVSGIANQMYWDNYPAVKAIYACPDFFLDHVQSRMNSGVFIEEENELI